MERNSGTPEQFVVLIAAEPVDQMDAELRT
jgi:hypothetical protein